MNPRRLLDHLRTIGLSLTVEGDQLLCAPKEKLTDELRALIREHKPALMALLADPTDWQRLAQSGLADTDVIPLDQAIFLFAIKRVQQTPVGELTALRSRYERHWRAHLPQEALQLIREEYQRRLSRTETAA